MAHVVCRMAHVVCRMAHVVCCMAHVAECNASIALLRRGVPLPAHNDTAEYELFAVLSHQARCRQSTQIERRKSRGLAEPECAALWLLWRRKGSR